MKHLQFITHATDRYTDLDEVRMALLGGCRWIQLRMKGATDDEVLSVGREAVRLCHHQHATLILDDRACPWPKLGRSLGHTPSSELLSTRWRICAGLLTRELTMQDAARFASPPPRNISRPCLVSTAIGISWLHGKSCQSGCLS